MGNSPTRRLDSAQAIRVRADDEHDPGQGEPRARSRREVLASLLAEAQPPLFKVGFFDDPALFWVVLALIAAIAPVTIVLAKRWEWI